MPNRTYHLIPHTHWDREWYLTRAAFVARLVPALDDLIARLESEPGFRAFVLDGQTVHLEDYLAVRERMPVATQLALADWTEREVPALAQRARRLRGQARAAGAMERGDTVRHAHPPEGY